MESKIDWSKAPEGYPVWIQGADTNFTSGWYRELFDRYESQKGTYYMKRDSSFFTANYRPTTPSWSGEGLPPVGAVCDVKQMARGAEREWFKAKVLYSSPYTVVLDDYQDGEFVSHPCTLQFRPIRTPEQIAHDKREAAINEMSRDSNFIGLPNRILLGGLYDAGYRKP